MASGDLKVTVSVELNDAGVADQLQALIKNFDGQTIAVAVDVDMGNLDDALAKIKELQDAGANVNVGINTDTPTSSKLDTDGISGSKAGLNEIVSLYAQLNKLQNEEFAIRKNLISATGEYKTNLQGALDTVTKQQNAVGFELAERGKLNSSVTQFNNLLNTREQKERAYESALAKNSTQLSQMKTQATEYVTSLKGLSANEITSFTDKINNIQTGNLREAQTAIRGITSEAKTAAGSVEDMARSLKASGDNAIAFGTAMTTAFGAGMAGIGYAVNEMMEFTAQMSMVEAVSGATTSEMQLLESAAKRVGASTKYSATQAGRIAPLYSNVYRTIEQNR